MMVGVVVVLVVVAGTICCAMHGSMGLGLNVMYAFF